MSSARIVPISAEHPDPGILAEAAALIRSGRLVAFPTETVYGLGANALDRRAIARIFSAKGRPSFNPVIAHVSSVAEARAIVAAWPEAAARLAASWWPGPLTMVLPKQSQVPDTLTAGAPAVAVRMPAHPVALGLIAAAGVPLAAPSANRSSSVSPTTAQHVAKSLGDRVDLILDAGPAGVGIESTVVDLTGPAPRILRPGPIGAAELEALIGPLERRAIPRGSGVSLLSPGQLDRHYAPVAHLLVFDAGNQGSVNARLQAEVDRGTVVGGLLLGATVPGTHLFRMPADPAGYARALYAALHQLDDLGCGVVAVEMVPDEILWAGVRDRLLRAAAPEGDPIG